MDMDCFEAYGDHAPMRTCKYWVRRFESVDFDTSDKDCEGMSAKFEDADLEALSDKDSRQTQEELAETLRVTQQGVSNVSRP
ncbi:hypothetical protein RB195_018161 [Necator americanus]|uniref:Mos1 transposase HTH domain-containing protein n=1 Tax=Necator americanus TaxID=51031 RepID=A0ABR1CA35_NECAM